MQTTSLNSGMELGGALRQSNDAWGGEFHLTQGEPCPSGFPHRDFGAQRGTSAAQLTLGVWLLQRVPNMSTPTKEARGSDHTHANEVEAMTGRQLLHRN